MNRFHRLSLVRTALAGAGVAVAALLAGCAAPGWGAAVAADADAAAGAAPTIAVPPTSVGTWYDLGHLQAPWLAGDAPVPVSGAAAPTRAAGLRREDGRWLAIVLAQVAPVAGAPCPQPTSLHLAAAGDGCLRLRRDADFDRWLERQHGVLYQWLDSRGWTARPRAWISHRVPQAGGQALEAHVLIEPALIEPTTRGSADFLAGGQPGLQWARDLAAATRAAGASGVLAMPPLPFAPPLAAPAAVPVASAVVTAPATAPVATQVPPRPPVPAPRRDRE